MSQLEDTLAFINKVREEGAGVGPLIVHQCELTAKLIDKLNEKPVRKQRTGKPEIGIQTYLTQCEEDGVHAIPSDDTIFEYAEEAAIPTDFISLCFDEFVERNTDSKTRKKNWRQHFRNCVRSNWYKLWYFDAGECKLTSTGQQALNKKNNRDK